MRFKKFVILMLAISFLHLGSGLTHAADRLENILERGHLIIGMELGYYPFDYIDDQGNPTGFDKEMAELFAQNLGIELVIVDLAWENLIPNLKAGTIDAIISAMTVTADRANEVDFSTPYFETGLAVLISKTKAPNIRNALELNTTGRIITVIADTDGAKSAGKLFPQAQIKPVLTEQDGVRAVVNANADAFLLDQLTIWKRHKEFMDATYALLKPLTLEEFAIAVAKNNPDLLKRTNQFIEALRGSDAYNHLLSNYFQDLEQSLAKIE